MDIKFQSAIWTHVFSLMVLSSNPSKVLADESNLKFFGFHPGRCYVQKTREF